MRTITLHFHEVTDSPSSLPDTPRCVQATDEESHFIACWENGEWINVHTEEPIDSHITAWAELPPFEYL